MICMIGLITCLEVVAQTPQTVVNDDHYGFTLISPHPMYVTIDSLDDEHRTRYQVYSSSYLTSTDTIYYRIDTWDQPIESSFNLSHDSLNMLHETLFMVEDRLNGSLIYSEEMSRNGWPSLLARYQLPSSKNAKVLLIQKEATYYLLTVISNASSGSHDSINRFLHSFRFY